MVIFIEQLFVIAIYHYWIVIFPRNDYVAVRTAGKFAKIARFLLFISVNTGFQFKHSVLSFLY